MSFSDMSSDSEMEPVRSPVGRADLIATAVNNIRLLFIVGCIGATLALVVGASLERQYRASARMLVDPRDLVILDEQVNPNTEADALGAAVESQVLVFTSSVVLNSVIDKLNLDEDPDFNGEESGGLSDLFASFASTEQTPEEIDAEQRQRRTAALETLEKSIGVVRLAPSFVLEISAQAKSKDVAQAIVEAVVSSFLQDLLRSRAEIARRASEDITAGMRLLREKVHELEEEIANYAAEHDLFEARDELLLNNQLEALTDQLVTARVETAKFKSQLDLLAGRELEALNSLPEALNSRAIESLRTAQSDIAVKRADLATSFSASTSTIRALEEQEQAIEDLIRDELLRIREGISVSYERALQNETDLEGKIEALRGDIVDANLAQIQKRELERELDAYHTIYNAALTRARQAREQARVNTANVRLISPAKADKDRVFPPPMPLLIIFGFVSFLFGAYFVLHVRSLARSGQL